ncbi:hypothetical protein CVS40_6843 [Lucilia cuprina]|nr:hypothetical protein CVS40_6843 [Lucilia cuprina]
MLVLLLLNTVIVLRINEFQSQNSSCIKVNRGLKNGKIRTEKDEIKKLNKCEFWNCIYDEVTASYVII